MKVLILVDWKVTDDTRFWVVDELRRLGYDVSLKGFVNYNPRDETTKTGKLKLWLKYTRLAIKGIRATKEADVIIHWNFVAGAIGAFLCRIFRIKRKLIALNMIAHKKGLLNTLLRKVVYNTAFKNRDFYVSVNDEQLAGIYNKLFQFPVDRMFVLHDVFYEEYEQLPFSEKGDFVFTGGDAYRDWEGLVRCAESLPDVSFVGVARKKNFPAIKTIPSNLQMYFDVAPDRFYQLVKESRLLFLPLNSEAPCGLIVMIRAAMLSKPVIISHTPSTKNYVQDAVTGRLVKIRDEAAMREAVDGLYHDGEKRKLYATQLKSFIRANFSVATNAAVIGRVIAGMMENENKIKS